MNGIIIKLKKDELNKWKRSCRKPILLGDLHLSDHLHREIWLQLCYGPSLLLHDQERWWKVGSCCINCKSFGSFQCAGSNEVLFSWLHLTSWRLFLMSFGFLQWDRFGPESQLRVLQVGTDSAIFVVSQSSFHSLTLASRVSQLVCFHSSKSLTPKQTKAPSARRPSELRL